MENGENKQKLILRKRSLRGEDGYQTFSIRIDNETVEKLNRISAESNRPRNSLINLLLRYCVDYCLIE